MPTAKQPAPMADAIAAGGLAIVGGGAWYAILMRRVWAATAYGPICGHSSPFQAHCVGCYASMALIVAGLGLIAFAGIRGRAARWAPARSTYRR